MASCRKPTYKVEIKPLSEKKRRKSDLVIMWQSVWNFSLSLLGKLWHISVTFWEISDLWTKADGRREVQVWLQTHLPKVPDDFSHSWRDGVLLSILLNKLQPGCYPEADKLDINFGLRNMHNAFNILEKKFNIVPEITVEELVTCSHGSESKFLELLLQLKQETGNKSISIKQDEKPDERKDVKSDALLLDNKRCIAKGTGLLVGFAGREANFVVFCSSMADLDLVIEIKGPCDTLCSERITKRSPKKKRIVKFWIPCPPGSVARSISEGEKSSHEENDASRIQSETQRYNIPLEYEIHMNQINFSYVPLMKGQHRVVILYNGQHVSDSPYEVIIEPSLGIYTRNLKSASGASCAQRNCEDTELKKESMQAEELNENQRRLGKVIKRRVLRYIVQIDSKDIVVEADSITNLATSLLKMDYELQKRPLSRRNSWGFVGDAERKVSMIRQFCVDLDELEAQSLRLQRSHSLIINSNVKKSRPTCTSYECEDIPIYKKLETVRESSDSDFKGSSLIHNEDDEFFARLDDVFESKDKTSKEQELKSFNEMISILEEREHFENKFIGDSISNDKILTNSNEFSDSVVKTEFLEVQNFCLTENTVKSPDHSVITSENSVSVDLEANGNTSRSSLSSVTYASAQNTTKCLSDTLEKENFVCENENERKRKSEDPAGKESAFERTKTESEDIKQDNKISKNLENYENVLVTEKPLSKTQVKNVQSILSQDRKQFSATHMNSRTSQIINPNDIFEERTSVKSARSYIKMPISIRSYCKCSGNKYRLLKIPTSRTNRKIVYFGRIDYKKCKQAPNKSKILLKWYSEKYKSLPNAKSQFSFETIRKNVNSDSKIIAKNSAYPENNHLIISLNTNCKMNQLENALPSVNSTKPKPSSIDEEMSQIIPAKHNIVSEIRPLISKCVSCQKASINHAQVNYSQEKEYENKAHNNNNISTIDSVLNFESKPRSVNVENNHIKVEPSSTYSKICPTQRKETLKLPINLESPFTKDFSDINTGQLHFIREKSAIESKSEMPIVRLENRIGNAMANHNPDSSFSVKTRNLVSLSQFNFKHFNPAPPPENKNNSRIKHRIKQWQNTINENSKGVKKIQKSKNVAETIDIKAKLKFWENIKGEGKRSESKKNQLNTEHFNNEKINLVDKKSAGSNITVESPVKGGDSKLMSHVITSQALLENSSCCVNQEINASWRKHTDDKLSLPMGTTKVRKRSFSDPCVTVTESLDSPYVDEIYHQQTSKEDMSSSTDANYIDLSADDEISSPDLHSTEDEYIDDEISESMSTYWGDLSLVKSLKLSSSSTYEEFYSLLESEYFKDRNSNLKFCPYECRVFGIANYFGHVAVKNRFWVLTNGAGNGNLSANVQGLGQHDVCLVSVKYMQKDIYEVTYQVLTPGLYLILLNWMETPILGSPFICKVTF